MLIYNIRKATQEDAGLLHSLLVKSKGVKFDLSRGVQRQDLSSLHPMVMGPKATKDHDASFEFDMNLAQPNCPACQAYLASVNGLHVGYLIFHYFYTPWRGRMVFVDDMFVDDNYEGRGIANKLLDALTDFCKRENLSVLLFNSIDIKKKLTEYNEGLDLKILRDDNTDWSVYRVDF